MVYSTLKKLLIGLPLVAIFQRTSILYDCQNWSRMAMKSETRLINKPLFSSQFVCCKSIFSSLAFDVAK